MGRFRRDRLAVHALEWGDLIVVVVRGHKLSVTTSEALKGCVLRLQRELPVIVDLGGVSRCGLAGVTAIRDLRQLFEARGRPFAVVADPYGQPVRALEAEPFGIRTYPNRHAARSALHYAAP